MSPTPYLRFVRRRVWSDKHMHDVNTRVLQQLWREHHMPAGETKPKEEWRDVAVVDEGETK